MSSNTLGRYEVLGELGRGAMGVVYLARDPLIGRQLALKTFRVDFSSRDEDVQQFRERFIREAQSAGILSHPNLVTIHDVVEGGGGEPAFIAMEYIQGTDLKQVLKSGKRLELAEVAEILDQISDGLDYAHAKGVVHRDIKPANIILTPDGKVKITDFGIARMDTSNLTQEGQLLGTPNYMAPEQITGGEVDRRADLFSLGVVLYEMITRHKPFAGDNLTVVTHRIVYDSFTPPEQLSFGLPAGVQGVLERALAKKPEDRYPKARDLAKDFRKAIEEDPLEALPSAEIPFGAGATAFIEEAASGEVLRMPELPPIGVDPERTVVRRSAEMASTRPKRKKARASQGEKPPWVRLALVALVALSCGVLFGAAGLVAADRLSPEVSRPTRQDRLRARLLPILKEARRQRDLGRPDVAARLYRRAELSAPEATNLPGLIRDAESELAELMPPTSQAEVVKLSDRAAAALRARRYDDAVALASSVLELDPRNRRANEILNTAQEAMRRRESPASARRPPAPSTTPPRSSRPASGAPPSPTPEVSPTLVEAATGTLEIDFYTEASEGVLTIYARPEGAGERQLYKETFEFVEKVGLFRRAQPRPGRLQATRELEKGAIELRVYLAVEGQATRVLTLQDELPGGERRTLRIRVSKMGELSAILE